MTIAPETVKRLDGPALGLTAKYACRSPSAQKFVLERGFETMCDLSSARLKTIREIGGPLSGMTVDLEGIRSAFTIPTSKGSLNPSPIAPAHTGKIGSPSSAPTQG